MKGPTADDLDAMNACVGIISALRKDGRRRVLKALLVYFDMVKMDTFTLDELQVKCDD